MTQKGKKQQEQQDSDSSVTEPEGSLSDLSVTPPKKAAKKAPHKKAAGAKKGEAGAKKKRGPKTKSQ
jgi:hypothetical protein